MNQHFQIITGCFVRYFREERAIQIGEFFAWAFSRYSPVTGTALFEAGEKLLFPATSQPV
ncbi:hypothetical protein HML84_07640 [Alcanivorax sp. IO_7]|nr:hypothetical protein HML84_07640 [Alcanivorax sp. IO_7]